MNIVKVDATNSTNSLARQINKSNHTENFCVSAEFQSEGRGQQESTWSSLKSKNLTFTLVFNHLNLDVRHHFLLNAHVCLGVLKVLNKYDIPNVFLKWPNDILAEGKKVCGILIENSLNSKFIKTSYIGIGLNVNQDHFEHLPLAISLKKILDRELDRDTLLELLVKELSLIPEKLRVTDVQKVLGDYKTKLYNYNKTTFFVLDNEKLAGKIIDISSEGKLKVRFDDGKISTFYHKEIKQLY